MVPGKPSLGSVLTPAFLSDQRPEDQRLIYSGRLLEDHQCLQDLLPKVSVALGSCFGVLSRTCTLKAGPEVSLITFSRKSDMFCTSCAM